MAMMLFLLACAPEPAAPAPRLIALDATRLARRMSIDLRGVLPSEAEMAAVQADPAQLDALQEEWLRDPRLEDRLVALFAERMLTRLDIFQSRYIDYGLPETENFEFVRSVGEEPLRLMAHVAVTDAPWTDIVTVDYTMANQMLRDAWTFDTSGESGGWMESRYTDGRPPAGILSTNGLWWRYVTNSSNLNRSRAAAVADLLLCEDYLKRPVTFSQTASLADEAGTAEAIRTEPACVGCHSSIDPLAANFFGFFTPAGYNADDMSNYHPGRETQYEELLDVQPAYFGVPTSGLFDVGVQVAADPRFVRCATANFTEALWRRPVTDGDFEQVESFRRDFITGGLTVRPLLRSILASEVYRAGGLGAGALASDEAEATVRLLSPDQLSSVVLDLTGFLWTWGGYEMLANDEYGFRVLAGGVDGDSVTTLQADTGLTMALVLKRVAEGAASYAVERELVGGASDPLLFTHVTLEDRPGDPDFATQLQALHARLYGTAPDAERLALDEALWADIAAESDAAEAWKGLVSAMLRDPTLLGY